MRLAGACIGFISYEYMKLKVRTPTELTYPDLQMDGLRFYDYIGSPRLKLKYMHTQEAPTDSSEEFGMDDV